jgi:hypothetical protein
MGLLEYQAMRSLRDTAHDGVLCTFSNRSALDLSKWFGPSGQAAWLFIMYKITPCWVTLLQPASQAGRRDRPALEPSASRNKNSVLGFFFSLPNWGPHPLTRPQASVSPLWFWGRDTLARRRGGGGPNSDEGTYTGVL